MGKKTSLRQKEMMLLHPNEKELIESIRSRFRFGRIEVITQDGLPIAIEKTVERISLNVIRSNDKM